MAGKISPKQDRFIERFLVHGNATLAAKEAEYSEKTAHVQGPRLLGNVSIAAEIARRQHARSERVKITQDMVLEGLLAEARRTDDGASHSARVSAWSQLGKHLGMFTDKIDHTTGGEKLDTINVVIRRAGEG